MTNKILRGCCWGSTRLSSADRFSINPRNKYDSGGFRVVKDVEPSLRVYRGGCWYLTAGFCRSAYRSRGNPSYRSDYDGFRVVKETPNG